MLGSSSTLDEIITAWKARKQEQSTQVLAASIQTIKLLAQGQPVTKEQLRSQVSLTEDEVSRYFANLEKNGCEFDGKGQLVGNALSLTPSPYQMQINGQALFAWCALDTLFLPAYVGQAAQVASTCHVTNIPISLTVTPKGVESLDPVTTVLSIVVPGITPSCDLKAKTGPQGPVCSTMHFFGSKEVATPWLKDNPVMAILSIEEAWQLAYAVWIEPIQQLS